MGSIFNTFDIARSGMFVNERALYVTGHNISNADTEGYVRQQVISTTAPYQTIPNKGEVGLGTDIDQIRQIRHTFLDNIYRDESKKLGYYEARNKTLQDVQLILDEPMGDGLQNVLNQFWDSWQELAKDPDSLTVRALVRQRGEMLSKQVNHMGEQIDKLQSDLNSEVNAKVEEVNKMSKQLAKLNVSILGIETSGDRANDLRDQRNVILDKLSKVAGVEIDEINDGQVSVNIGGYYLVDRATSRGIMLKSSPDTGFLYALKSENGEEDIQLKSGELKGLFEARGEINGSIEASRNGLSNTKVDINFVVDTSNTSVSYLDKVKSSVKNYVDELKKSGLDFNLRLVSYDSASTVNSTVWTKDTVDTKGSSFEEAVGNLSTDIATQNNFSYLVSTMTEGAANSIGNYRDGASKYAIVFTDETIGGDENPAISVSEKDMMLNSLAEQGIKVSVVSNANAYGSGSQVGETVAWSDITQGTNGNFYDIDSTDYNGLVSMINRDIVNDKNTMINNIASRQDIMPEIKERLNAMINVMVREINYLHSGGNTLGEKKGSEFFTAIDDTKPIGMGNMKINDNLGDLDKIVASSTSKNGDNVVALSIANLRNSKIMSDETGELSIDEYYQSIISKIGAVGAEAERVMTNQEKLVDSADSVRKAITDVSMDEELTNMMKYKYAYGAASKVMNVVDQMLDTIITKLGIVGR